MLRVEALALGLLFAMRGWPADKGDVCALASSTSDVQFELALLNHGAGFQAGEIVPLALSFRSTTTGRYTVDMRNRDRSGRLGSEHYCVEPETPDPLESYFQNGAFLGGGLGSEQRLDSGPVNAVAELNEWRSLPPGHYKVYAISYRVWRPRDPHEETQYTRVSETLRSNRVDIEVSAADPVCRASN
jgi:hypothetical protein